MTKDHVSDYLVVQTEEQVKKFKIQKRKHWILLTGTSLMSLGLIILVFWPLIYNTLKNLGIVMSPHSYKYLKWKDDLVPIKMNVYFFNWTNPEDVYDISIKPKFTEIGPYVFSEHRFRVNVKWNDNGTITFQQKRFWYFDKKSSPQKLTDKVTTVNAIALSAAYKVRTLGYFHSKALSGALATMKVKVYTEKTIGELLFDGYEDQLLNIGRNLPFLPKGTVPQMKKFCWFHGRNGTTEFDGTLNVITGVTNLLGDVKRVNYEPNIPYHYGECGRVKGSVGDIYPPNLQKHLDLDVYTPELCRDVPVEYLGTEDTIGLTTYKYILGPKFLDNGTIYPGNKCYYEGENTPSGVYNVSLCRYGTPSFISLPHFYGADPFYTTTIDGMQPNKDQHEFYMNVEPEMGIPIQVRARVQVNMLMQTIPTIKLFNNMPRRFLPIMWFEQKADIPQDLAFLLKLLLKFPTMSLISGCSFMFFGGVILLIVFLRKFSVRQLKHYEPCKTPIL